MADLSAYIDFSVQLDKSVITPVIRLTDTGTYPAGVPLYLQGVFSVTQPDGLTVTGNFITPDVAWSGSALSVASKELRLSTDDTLQNGIYSITYTINCIGYSTTVLTKTFTLDYTAAVISITDLTDVFTPSLQEVDSTSYSQAGFTLSSVTRAWSADIKYVSTTVQTVTGTATLLDMAYSGTYYDAHYSISLASIVTLVGTLTNTWVTVLDKLTADTQIDAYTPPTLANLRASLTTLKQQIEQGTYCGSNCPCACEESEVYTLAVSVYEHLVSRGQAGETIGLDAYVLQLQKIFNCNGVITQAHTNAALPVYDWGITVTAAPHTPIQFTVDSGGAYAPAAGTTDYNNPTIVGNNNYTIYRQGQGDFLVENVDFIYLVTGGFELLPAAGTFQSTERFTLVFFQA